MEGIFGIEPKHSESKSDALPLCYIPIVWRKMWDSNPRNAFTFNSLAGSPDQPLWQSSVLKWRPIKESNPDLWSRNPLHYPLC